MSAQVARITPTLPGLLPDADAQRIVDSFNVERDGITCILDRMPTKAERQVMSQRALAIAEALRPIGELAGDRKEAEKILATLLIGYGIGMRDRNAAQTITSYLGHLGDLPLFAIRAASEDVRQGRVYDVDHRTGNRTPISLDFPPSPMRLHAVAQKHVQIMGEEKWRLDCVLGAKLAAPPPTDEMRAAISKGLSDLVVHLTSLQAASDLKDRQRRDLGVKASIDQNERAILAEYDRLGLEPVRAGTMLLTPTLAQRAGKVIRKTAKRAKR